jgi:hypothetical protein
VGTKYHRAPSDQFHNKIKPNLLLTLRPAGIPAGLIFLNAPTAGCQHETDMSHPSTIAERLLAHARICREVADATLNEKTARQLEQLAEDCVRAARDVEPVPQFQWVPSPAAG